MRSLVRLFKASFSFFIKAKVLRAGIGFIEGDM